MAIRCVSLPLRRAAKCFSSAPDLKKSAAAAFTGWHASELSAALEKKCADNTGSDRALLAVASCFTLQHADVQRCQVGEVAAEVTRKTFATPAGQLHFHWECCHSQMPMELPLRWNLSLLLRPAGHGSVSSPSDPEWTEEGFVGVAEGAMAPDARGPPMTFSEDVQELARLMEAMETASTVGGAGSTPLPRRDLVWLLSFLCGEPSDFAFDSLSGTLEALDAS